MRTVLALCFALASLLAAAAEPGGAEAGIKPPGAPGPGARPAEKGDGMVRIPIGRRDRDPDREREGASGGASRERAEDRLGREADREDEEFRKKLKKKP